MSGMSGVVLKIVRNCPEITGSFLITKENSPRSELLRELAGAVRFELTDAFTSAVFKTAGLNHSPKPPDFFRVAETISANCGDYDKKSLKNRHNFSNSPVFKTGAFNRSATDPQGAHDNIGGVGISLYQPSKLFPD